MKRFIITLSVIFISLSIFSQIVWKAELDSVRESGYFNIEIDQELIGGSKYKLLDLRIVNSKGIEVPYFLREATSVQEVSSFEDYDLIGNTTKDSLNILIVKNENKENINRFYTIISKADVNVDVSIRGSNDSKQWYIVKQRTAITLLKDQERSDAMIILDFPSGNYEYYEITLHNSQQSPLEVKGIKKLKSSHIYGKFPEIILANKIDITTKDKQTFITFPEIKSEYIIGKIEFFINNKTEYLRSFVLKDTVTNHTVVNFNLSSKSDNTFYLISDDLKLTRNTVGIINNHNNPPLSVDSIKVYGLERYACAYLDHGEKYYMEVGRESGAYPDYDIEHFKNDIKTDLPIVRSVNISKSELPKEPQREQLFIEKPIFLWSIIIGVGVLLTIVSVSMLIKMKKRDEE